MPPSALRWQLTVAREDHGPVAVFVVSGRLGTLSAGDLIEALTGAIANGVRRIVLDVSGVDYLSSAGLLALDAVLGRLHMVDGHLVICGITEPVRIAFELSGLLAHFRETPSRADALVLLHADSVPARS
jgi:anti-anti-sigma factor